MHHANHTNRAPRAIVVLIIAGLTASLLAVVTASPAGAATDVLIEKGVNDRRISHSGTDGEQDPFTGSPAVAYNPDDDEYLVVWHGFDHVADEQFGSEIFAQRLNDEGTPIGDQIRVSDMGPDDNDDGWLFSGAEPAVAYNSNDHEYLVVWYGDDDTGGLVTGELEIFAQRLSATGNQLGVNDFRVSDMGPDGSFFYEVNDPAVVYNPDDNQYLVVWQGEDNTGGLADDEYEIFAQRLSATGDELGVNDFRVSDMGGTGDGSYDARRPAVAYNPDGHEYLVVWSGDDNTGGLVNGEYEIFAQRLTWNGGAKGVNDLRVSDMGGTGNTDYDAFDPAVAYNTDQHEYLITWRGDDDTGGLADGELEIFAQRLTATGAELGINDFRVSDMGPNGNTDYDAFDPAVAYNATDYEYLVVWYGDDNTGNLADDELEIFAQRLAWNGGAKGTNDMRISDMGGTGDIFYDGAVPALSYNPDDHEYLAVWEGDDNIGGLVNDEFEVFGQRLGHCDPQNDVDCPGYCDLHPEDLQCGPCDDNLDEPECLEKFCEEHPNDPICLNCDPQVDPQCPGSCELHPDDPQCGPQCDPQVDADCGGYCPLHPNDFQHCPKVYCNNHPNDAKCDNNGGGGGGGGGEKKVCVEKTAGFQEKSYYNIVTRQGRVYSHGEVPFAADFSGLLAPGESVVGAAGTEKGDALAVVTDRGRVLGQGDLPTVVGQVPADPAGDPIVGLATNRPGDGFYVGFGSGRVVTVGNAVPVGDWTDEGLVRPVADFETAFPSEYKKLPPEMTQQDAAFYGTDAKGAEFTAFKGGNANFITPFSHSLYDINGENIAEQLRAPVDTIVVIQPDCEYDLPRNVKIAKADGGAFHAPGTKEGDPKFTAFCGSGVSYYQDTLGYVPAVGTVPDFIDGQQWGRYCTMLLRQDGLIVINEGNDPTTRKWTPKKMGDAQGQLVPGDEAAALVTYVAPKPLLAQELGINYNPANP